MGAASTTAIMVYAKTLTQYYPEIVWASRTGEGGSSTIRLTQGQVKLAIGGLSSYVDCYGYDKIPSSIKEFLEAKSEPEVYVQINVPSNKRLDRNQREITFTCKFCGKPKPIEESRIITRFFPPLPACRDCFKLMD